MKLLAWLAVAILGAALSSAAVAASTIEGKVVDAATASAIAGATVTVGQQTTQSDATGHFKMAAEASRVMVRAPGYRQEAVVPGQEPGALVVRLEPFRPRALYLSLYGVGHAAIRDAALQLIRKGGLNALVIDLKSERGLIAFPSAVLLVHEIGADRIVTIRNPQEFIRNLHSRGIYAIARLVVFADDALATNRPDLAVKTAGGSVFRDRKGLAWTDPFRPEVWKYDIAVAVEAARAGFDEIQFDYVRFPDTKNLRFARDSTQSTRVQAIIGFLSAARQALLPYNIYIAVDVFGYVCWNLDDTGVGQRLKDILPLIDYISPMLYPSGFQFGIPGYPDPVIHPQSVVRLSLDRALARTQVSALRFRPWLQAFRDYAFDRRTFGAAEVRRQIGAAESFGSDGWMLWNPRNVYTGIGF